MRTAILAFTVAPPAPSAPAPERRTLTSGRRAVSGPRAQHGRTVRLTGEASAAEARTAPGRVAHGRCRLGAGRSGSGDGAPRAVPGVLGAVRTSGRRGSGPACPYLRKLSSKALLYRCAVSRAGCYGRVTAVDDRGLLGAVNALVSLCRGRGMN